MFFFVCGRSVAKEIGVRAPWVVRHSALPPPHTNTHLSPQPAHKTGDDCAGAVAVAFGNVDAGTPGGELMTAANASAAADFARLRVVPELAGTAPSIGEGIAHCTRLLTAASPLNNTRGHGKVAVLVTAAVRGAPSPNSLSEATSATKSGVMVLTVGGADTETLALPNTLRVRADAIGAVLADLGARVAAALCAVPPLGRFKQTLWARLYAYDTTGHYRLDSSSKFPPHITDSFARRGALAVEVSGQCSPSPSDFDDPCDTGFGLGSYPPYSLCRAGCSFNITYTGTFEIGHAACSLVEGAGNVLCSYPVPA